MSRIRELIENKIIKDSVSFNRVLAELNLINNPVSGSWFGFDPEYQFYYGAWWGNGAVDESKSFTISISAFDSGKRKWVKWPIN